MGEVCTVVEGASGRGGAKKATVLRRSVVGWVCLKMGVRWRGRKRKPARSSEDLLRWDKLCGFVAVLFSVSFGSGRAMNSFRSCISGIEPAVLTICGMSGDWGQVYFEWMDWEGFIVSTIGVSCAEWKMHVDQRVDGRIQFE